jgi:putative phosphoesterase
MLLALLSDTHDNEAMTRMALERLKEHAPAAYLHAGDLVSAEMLGCFEGLPFHFVFGNNEYDHTELRSLALAKKLHCHEFKGELTFGEKKIALLHGHEARDLNRAVTGGKFHYVIHGHTHVRRDERVRGEGGAAGTRIINPGALHRTREKSVALLDVAADVLTFLNVP